MASELRHLHAIAAVDRYLSDVLHGAARPSDEIVAELRTAQGLRRLDLLQLRHEARLEKEFISVAADFGQRAGISYRTWREVGVPAVVLRRAGIRPRPA